jgi:hypothetical protein
MGERELLLTILGCLIVTVVFIRRRRPCLAHHIGASELMDGHLSPSVHRPRQPSRRGSFHGAALSDPVCVLEKSHVPVVSECERVNRALMPGNRRAGGACQEHGIYRALHAGRPKSAPRGVSTRAHFQVGELCYFHE